MTTRPVGLIFELSNCQNLWFVALRICWRSAWLVNSADTAPVLGWVVRSS